jgi:prevent-host-death family protein
MKTVTVSEFKAKCVVLLEEVQRTGEPIEVTKRGKPIAVVNPPAKTSIDWRPGAFKGQTKILGDITGDLSDLGVEWEAMQ